MTPADPLAELRTTLHRAADLLVDVLEERRRRTPRARAIPVDDVSRAFAQKTLKRLGWSR
jgi:hypothetical protein